MFWNQPRIKKCIKLMLTASFLLPNNSVKATISNSKNLSISHIENFWRNSLVAEEHQLTVLINNFSVEYLRNQIQDFLKVWWSHFWDIFYQMLNQPKAPTSLTAKWVVVTTMFQNKKAKIKVDQIIRDCWQSKFSTVW